MNGQAAASAMAHACWGFVIFLVGNIARTDRWRDLSIGANGGGCDAFEACLAAAHPKRVAPASIQLAKSS